MARRFEYLVVQTLPVGMGLFTGRYGKCKATSLNGAKIKDWAEGPFIWDFINQLGNEGWELIQMVRNGDMYFKRERNPSSEQEH